MARFLVDANLPYRFSLWQGPEYLHAFDWNDAWPDSEIWRYARERVGWGEERTPTFSDRGLTLGFLRHPNLRATRSTNRRRG